MNQQQLQSDLEYVRDVVSRSDRRKTPAPIYYFWAVATLVGFSIVDYEPRYAGIFWAVVGPAGWIVSALLGRAYGGKSGEVNRRAGLRYGAHWAGLMGAILLLWVGVMLGAWPAATAGQLVLLVLALTYVLAGIHVDRAMVWIGLLIAAGYLALFFVSGPIWTITGVAVAAGLALTPWLENRAND